MADIDLGSRFYGSTNIEVKYTITEEVLEDLEPVVEEYGYGNDINQFLQVFTPTNVPDSMFGANDEKTTITMRPTDIRRGVAMTTNAKYEYKMGISFLTTGPRGVQFRTDETPAEIEYRITQISYYSGLIISFAFPDPLSELDL